MQTGFITSVNAGRYEVYNGETIIPCRARGKFRIGEYTPLVGDLVEFDEKEQYLLTILPRKNSFVRPPIANVDQVLIVASLVHPPVSLRLINRFLVLSAISGIKPLIALSKTDLMTLTQTSYQRILDSLYQLDYEIFPYSSKTKEGIDGIAEKLNGKKTVFTGQSGVGKSSLINALIPEYQRETGEISVALGRGKHITRVVEYLPYHQGWIADTPGFSLIDFDIRPLQLAQMFPGFQTLSLNCKFRDCLHESEIGCAIKQAVADGQITQDQYDIYRSILEELKQQKERY